MYDEQTVRRNWRQASDEELYDLLAFPDGNIPEVLEVARAELRSRNLDPADDVSLASASQRKTAGDIRVAAAMRVNRLFWVFLALMVTLGFGVGLYQSFSKRESDFKVNFLRAATGSCTRRAVSRGIPEASAYPVCACMAQYLVDHNSMSSLTKYELDRNTPAAQRALEEADTACQEGSFVRKYGVK